MQINSRNDSITSLQRENLELKSRIIELDTYVARVDGVLAAEGYENVSTQKLRGYDLSSTYSDSSDGRLRLSNLTSFPLKKTDGSSNRDRLTSSTPIRAYNDSSQSLIEPRLLKSSPYSAKDSFNDRKSRNNELQTALNNQATNSLGSFKADDYDSDGLTNSYKQDPYQSPGVNFASSLSKPKSQSISPNIGNITPRLGSLSKGSSSNSPFNKHYQNKSFHLGSSALMSLSKDRSPSRENTLHEDENIDDMLSEYKQLMSQSLQQQNAMKSLLSDYQSKDSRKTIEYDLKNELNFLKQENVSQKYIIKALEINVRKLNDQLDKQHQEILKISEISTNIESEELKYYKSQYSKYKEEITSLEKTKNELSKNNEILNREIFMLKSQLDLKQQELAILHTEREEIYLRYVGSKPSNLFNYNLNV